MIHREYSPRASQVHVAVNRQPRSGHAGLVGRRMASVLVAVVVHHAADDVDLQKHHCEDKSKSSSEDDNEDNDEAVAIKQE